MGLEPTTLGATVQCSTVELHSPRRVLASSRRRQRDHSLYAGAFGLSRDAPGGNRTPDLRLRRPLLYPTELLARGNIRKIGVKGFEPSTPCAQGRCATRLRYTPRESRTANTRGPGRQE